MRRTRGFNLQHSCRCLTLVSISYPSKMFEGGDPVAHGSAIAPTSITAIDGGGGELLRRECSVQFRYFLVTT